MQAIKSRIESSTKRMGLIRAGRSIAPDLQERDWKDAAEWAVGLMSSHLCPVLLCQYKPLKALLIVEMPPIFPVFHFR